MRALAAWMFASVVAVMISGRFLWYYFVLLLPGLALLIGFNVFSPPWQWQRRVLSVGFAAVFAVLILLALAANVLDYAQPTAVQRFIAKVHSVRRVRDAQSVSVAADIARRTRPSDTIYNLGQQSELYLYSNRQPASRYLHTFPLASDPRTVDGLLADLEQNKPVYIIDTELPMYLQGIVQTYPWELGPFLQRNYVLERRIEFDDDLAAMFRQVYALERPYSTLTYYADVWRLKDASTNSP
jgi:hypothetical protein